MTYIPTHHTLSRNAPSLDNSASERPQPTHHPITCIYDTAWAKAAANNFKQQCMPWPQSFFKAAARKLDHIITASGTRPKGHK